MQRFVETASYVAKPVEVTPQLRERAASFQNKLREAGQLSEAASSPTVWEVPISRYDYENVNGRVYPRALWERVIEQQRPLWEGSPMLADHPSGDSDGSPEKICGIWLEARMGNDGYVYGQFVPSGSLGRDLQEHLVNGLKAGTSSSGFGELQEDRKTVDPATFQIERLSDWVLAPSQGTYFTYEASTHEAKNSSQPHMSESGSPIKEKTTMATMSRLEEKKFRRDMEAFLEGAEKLSNPQERLAEFEEVLSFLEEGAVPDLREAVEAKIEAEKARLAKQLENARELEETLGVDTADELKERLEYLATEASALQEEGQDWERVATLLQERIAKLREELNKRPTPAYVERLKDKIKKLRASIAEGEKARAAIEQKLSEAKNALKQQKHRISEDVSKLSATFKEKADAWSKKEEMLSGKIRRLQVALEEAESKNEAVANEFGAYKEEAERVPTIEPRYHERVKGVLNFQESDEIEKYWADLAVRHGKAILPYKRHIVGSKTYREATLAYIKLLPLLEETQGIDASRIPESVSLSLKERGQMLENVGVHIEPNSSVVSRMPKGWT